MSLPLAEAAFSPVTQRKTRREKFPARGKTRNVFSSVAQDCPVSAWNERREFPFVQRVNRRVSSGKVGRIIYGIF